MGEAKNPWRPTKLTPETQRKIVSAIQAGNYLEVAAAYAGIAKESLYKWLRKGARASTGIHRDFALAVEQALAQAEVRDVALIGEAAKKEWTAAAWRLERKFPDRWGRRERLPPAEDNKKVVEIEVSISGQGSAAKEDLDADD